MPRLSSPVIHGFSHGTVYLLGKFVVTSSMQRNTSRRYSSKNHEQDAHLRVRVFAGGEWLQVVAEDDGRAGCGRGRWQRRGRARVLHLLNCYACIAVLRELRFLASTAPPTSCCDLNRWCGFYHIVMHA
jgi:hypothetical protein